MSLMMVRMDGARSLWKVLIESLADSMCVDVTVNIETWANTVQAAVTAIREVDATSHYILLPGKAFPLRSPLRYSSFKKPPDAQN